jgi:hypothetical protein
LLNLLPENAAIMPTDKPKSKHSMLPLLIVLFLVSYGLLTLLVVEQGRTIDAQRFLIRQLFHDSAQLSALQGQAIQKQHAKAEAKAEARARAKAQAEARSKTPSSQAVPQEEASRKPSGKLRRPLPQRPPEDASEPADERRTLLSI